MTDTTPTIDSGFSVPKLRPSRSDDHMAPTGLQDLRDLARRRAVVVALNLATLAALSWGIYNVFSVGGWSASDIIIVICFFLGAPWTIMGLWNALIGMWLLHGRRGGVALAAPHLATELGGAPLTTRTAVAMTLRNEDTARALDRLAEVRRGLDATGQGDAYDFFVLSDSSDPEVIATEERLFHERRHELGGDSAHYRRRLNNTGFKAGNVREFLANQGHDYDFYLPLDSDSLMGGQTILRMTRIMEAHPKLGILQSLVVGTPTTSAFARIFQFGMRHGMRSFTIGAAWWQGDCGPYWGHNALIRVKPFRRFCRLPILPGKPPLGGHMLSHDQVEAVMIRRAGYEVRVMPVETESYEDNPPTLMDFTKRDLRWCQGNMQYWRILGMRGLRPVSRFQIFAAIMMYIGAPAWMLMTLAAASKLVETDGGGVNVAFGIAMFFIMFAVSLVPKLMGLLDIALTPGGAARYGGRLRFAISGFVELVFSTLIAPVVAFRVTLFLIGLVFGKSMMWSGQNRDAYRLTWGDALRGLWPQTLFGAALTTAIIVFAGLGTVVWAAPMVTGLVLSIPLAVFTADPRVGAWAQRIGFCAIPDEIAPTDSIERIFAPRPATGTPPLAAPAVA
ncbi:glucans biosynthesis glucosyltransferase MdoH [Rhodobacteraceae bacterium NNCM2]|nr:glucans biosynthesis glucosyltransferase MdoH [Coraliihabitans acroporae]